MLKLTNNIRYSPTMRISAPGLLKRSFHPWLGFQIQNRKQGYSGEYCVSDFPGTLFIFVCRLRDGRSIRTVSALLLQLVQTSAHGVRVEASRLAKSHLQQLALKRQDSLATGAQEAWLDQMDIEVRSIY